MRSLGNVTLMPRTSVLAVYDGNSYAALERVSDHVAMPAPIRRANDFGRSSANGR